MKSLRVLNKRDELARDHANFGTDPSPYSYAPDLSTEAGKIEASIVERLKQIYDPELPVNIFELGLIYGIDVGDHGKVHLTMTLTAPNCPVAQELPEQARLAAESHPDVQEATLELTWTPPWNPSMMSEAAQLELNLF